MVYKEEHEWKYSGEHYPFQKEASEIIGICMEVHRILGKGLLEVVYKDALEYELIQRHINFEREKKYVVEYKGIILRHHFIADFVVNNIIVEIRAQPKTVDQHYSQLLNYMTIAKSKVGLLINFGEHSLQFKRLIL